MGKTTNVECKVDWKTVLVFVSIAFSSQCGGGFASGSTPWTYFFRNTGFYGMLPVVAQPYFCLFMPFIVAAINCFIIYFFMKFAMDFRTFDYSSFLRRYGSRFCNGIFARPMQYIYEFNFNWLLIVCMALAYLRTTTSKNAYFSRIKAADKKKFREQLALLDMGLEDRMKQPVGLLSGGQRQALTLLMATMVTPKILLLDEHTAALDPATAEKVLNLTKKIVSEQNITCLMVTHNMHQALELGNRTLMMDSGNIVLDVSGEEREKMSVDDLLEQFAVRAGKALDNDRILFSKVEA